MVLRDRADPRQRLAEFQLVLSSSISLEQRSPYRPYFVDRHDLSRMAEDGRGGLAPAQCSHTPSMNWFCDRHPQARVADHVNRLCGDCLRAPRLDDALRPNDDMAVACFADSPLYPREPLGGDHIALRRFK